MRLRNKESRSITLERKASAALAMDMGAGTIEDLFHDLSDPHTELWLAVIEKMLIDYAYLVRANETNNITKLQQYQLKLLTRSIFDCQGSLIDILVLISKEPAILADIIRATVSPEKIKSEIVLGRKMREIEF